MTKSKSGLDHSFGFFSNTHVDSRRCAGEVEAPRAEYYYYKNYFVIELVATCISFTIQNDTKDKGAKYTHEQYSC